MFVISPKFSEPAVMTLDSTNMQKIFAHFYDTSRLKCFGRSTSNNK